MSIRNKLNIDFFFRFELNFIKHLNVWKVYLCNIPAWAFHLSGRTKKYLRIPSLHNDEKTVPIADFIK